MFKKGYQDFDNVQGAITTKVKGVAMSHGLFNNGSERVWDVNDYVVPPQVSSTEKRFCLLPLVHFVFFNTLDTSRL